MVRVPLRTSLLIAPLAAALAAHAAPAQGDGWVGGFHLSDLDDRATALTVFDSGAGKRLVAVGEFHCAGPEVVNHVAAWDGAQWSALGAGIDWGPTGLRCAAEFDDGSGPALYVGGRFAGPNGAPAANVARWDGSSWSTLGTLGGGLAEEVAALAAFDDGSGPALYAAGRFATAGGQPVQNIARWDGASWHALGAGVDAGVSALVVYDDGTGPALFVGGGFTSAGGLPASGIARWDGSAWSSLPAGFSSWISALGVHDDGAGPALYAAGAFAPLAGGPPRSGVVRWKLGVWSFVGDLGIGAAPKAIAAYDEGHGSGPALFVAGSNYWGATVWRRRGSLLLGVAFTEPSDQSDLDALVAVDFGWGPQLVAGGWFHAMHALNPEQRPVPAMNVAAWDGDVWSRLGSGGQGLNAWVRTLAAFHDPTGSPGQVAALGWFTLAGDQLVSGAALWAGAGWELLADDTPDLQALIEDPTAPGSGAFYAAVGQHVRHWDGTSWSRLAGLDGDVGCFGFHDSGSGPELVAGGSFDVPGAPSGQAVARWDGSAWHGLGLQGAARALTTWTPSPGAAPRLVVAGSLDAPVWGQGVALLESGAWTTLGGGLVQGTPLSLASMQEGAGTALYLGGSFSAVAGVPARSIARWDGRAWSELKGGVDGEVRALAVRTTSVLPELFVAGDFSLAGGLPAHNIARWDGASWSALGPPASPGTNATIEALAVVGQAVYAGGQFTLAGGQPSAHLACWSP